MADPRCRLIEPGDGIIVGAARRLVVDAQADEVADRDHPDDRLALDDGKVPEAAVDHDRRRVAGRLVGVDRVRVVGHRLRHSALDPVGRDRPEHVTLGQDPDEPLAVQDDDGADAALVHPACGVQEARLGCDPEDVLRHDLADGGHGAIVRPASRFG